MSGTTRQVLVRMVVVAQLVEHRVVVPGVAGSNPVGHPTELPGQKAGPKSRTGPLPVGAGETVRPRPPTVVRYLIA